MSEGGRTSGSRRRGGLELDGPAKAWNFGQAGKGMLDLYRDMNNVFGDFDKLAFSLAHRTALFALAGVWTRRRTPSSECVGDLALYLVTRDLKATDVSDPTKKGRVNLPGFVSGLLHRAPRLPAAVISQQRYPRLSSAIGSRLPRGRARRSPSPTSLSWPPFRRASARRRWGK
ncbi:unnamed protein product [Scytosiphon promiscuus]